jgi:epoxyqueuosine reductase
LESLRNYLLKAGADIVGYADLTQIDPAYRSNLPFGISIGISLNPNIVRKIPSNMAIVEYGEEYDRLNDKLDELCLLTGKYIVDRGFQVVAQTTDFINRHNPGRAQLPHKTVAALSGLGWISKSSLLITPQFGSALRLTSALTNMPLKTSPAEYHCKCGNCTICVDACPGHAIKGTTWDISTDRDDLVNLSACREITKSRGKPFDRSKGTCGICVAVCPYTKKHLSVVDR